MVAQRTQPQQKSAPRSSGVPAPSKLLRNTFTGRGTGPDLPRAGHDFSRVPVHRAAPHATRPGTSDPVSIGSLTRPEEPHAVFDEAGNELAQAPPATDEPDGMAGDGVAGATDLGVDNLGATATAGAAAVSRTVIVGPRELWYFDGETPADYAVSSRLRTNRAGGTFRWSVSPQLSLSSDADAAPTVTTGGASVTRRDAWVRVEHTAADGTLTNASYRMTVRAPNTLVHGVDVCSADATWGYDCQIHYSIQDNVGDTLPRDVPINERFTAAPTADSPGMDWRRGAEGAALVNPADWFDHIQGETAGHTPAPVGPGDPGANDAVYHWPGDWRVGSLTIGSGRLVATVTWQKYRGHAEHL